MKRPMYRHNWMCLPINYYSLSYQLCILRCVHGSSLQNETDYLYYKFFFCGTSRILHMQFKISFCKTHNNAKRFTNRLVTKELQTYQPWIMVRYNCLHFFFLPCLGGHVFFMLRVPCHMHFFGIIKPPYCL
jgi:hypothetical protein